MYNTGNTVRIDLGRINLGDLSVRVDNNFDILSIAMSGNDGFVRLHIQKKELIKILDFIKQTKE